MYDPILGRWLEQDPIGLDAGDINLYRFVKNDPTTGVDPSGLKVVKVVNIQTGLNDSDRHSFYAYVPDDEKTRLNTL